MKIALFATAALLFVGYVHAHSGDTDSNGCHTDHRTGQYHCHRLK